MGHTYTKAHFHIVFSTKSRQKLICKLIARFSYVAAIALHTRTIADKSPQIFTAE